VLWEQPQKPCWPLWGYQSRVANAFDKKNPESPYLNLFGGQVSKDELAKLISEKQDVTQGDLKRCLRFFMDP
jgi:hypothetical protein